MTRTSELEWRLRESGLKPESIALASEANARLMERYSSENELWTISAAVRAAFVADNYDGDLGATNILDIGCGAECSEDGFKPWLARALSSIGANVIGIDIARSHGENYTHVVADLTREQISDVVENRKYGVVLCNAFLDSPKLGDSIGDSINARIWLIRQFPGLLQQPSGVLITDAGRHNFMRCRGEQLFGDAGFTKTSKDYPDCQLMFYSAFRVLNSGAEK